MSGFLKEPAVNYRGNQPHQHHIDGEGSVGVQRQKASGAREEDHGGVDQGIQGIHSQQTGRHNGVVDDGLKHDGRSADGKRCDEHDDELRRAQPHRIAEQLFIFKVHLHQHVSRCRKQDKQSQDQQLFMVSAQNGMVQCSSPFLTALSVFSQGELPAAKKRTARLPFFSRYKSRPMNRTLPRIPTISSMGSS